MDVRIMILTPALALSGIGKYATDTNPQNPVFQSQIAGIIKGLEFPAEVGKDEATWCIPTNGLVRAACRATTTDDELTVPLIWLDIDEGNVQPEALKDAILAIVDGANFHFYDSKSSTAENRKYRVLFVLDELISRNDYQAVTTHINDKLEALGIKPDRSNQKPFQVFYLPNKGEYYEYHSFTGGVNLNAIKTFDSAIQKQKQLDADELEASRKRTALSMAKRKQRTACDFKSPVDAFNASYTVEELLTSNGYKQRGSHFMHPNSETGSYSASVKDGRVHSLSSADPLYSENGAHDAFSVFTVLKHNGDRDSAIKDACDNHLFIGSETWNEHSQREFKASKQQSVLVNRNNEPLPPKLSALQKLRSFSANGSSEKMREQMLDEIHVFKDLAILGQWTTFYAEPNVGKTLFSLWLLREQIQAKELKGENVFYVNADDNYKGSLTKLELAERIGFHMLLPDNNGFKKEDVLIIMKDLVTSGEAKGTVFILDTLKKFTNLMDKTMASDFGNVVRGYVAAGGTVIALAHVNKKKNEDGQSIHAGTSDIKDDCDCVYIIEKVGGNEPASPTRTVSFINDKCRGNVAPQVTFKYDSVQGQDYQTLLDSVKRVGEKELAIVERLSKITAGHENDREIMDSILSTIATGEHLKGDLVALVVEDTLATKTKITKVLKRWQGTDYEAGHRWHSVKGEKNAQFYKATISTNCELNGRDDYLAKKQGEY